VIGEKKNGKKSKLIRKSQNYKHVSPLAYCLHILAGRKSLCTAEKAKGSHYQPTARDLARRNCEMTRRIAPSPPPYLAARKISEEKR